MFWLSPKRENARIDPEPGLCPYGRSTNHISVTGHLSEGLMCSGRAARVGRGHISSGPLSIVNRCPQRHLWPKRRL